MITIAIDEVSFSLVFYNFDGLRCETLFLRATNAHFLKIDYEKIQMLELKCKNFTLISK